ncbi:transcriptional regulator [Rhizocola hellebori]|uniref:Transcriptional regulator n=1 Tax=Rhizocola hellebori TaxID=1392758 RepID=A0A8J3QEL6_9ACTN|nr:helix-turn-helix domain-containing protein [Rhizocola hellebori]GIH09434.1 transcriptional regulator [Rhizocola hellebori]
MDNHPALDDAFLALADSTRRSVLTRLARGPASVSELAAPSSMALPSFMKHIRLLERSGWIRTHKSGRTRTCVFEPSKLPVVDDWLAQQRALWEARTDRLERFIDLETE